MCWPSCTLASCDALRAQISTYAVDNHTIAKFEKDGTFVARKDYADIGILHLDSAAVVHGKIYCSHSNYRYFPMTSSIVVFDADTLDHIGSHSLGIRLGSLTWLDKHDGYFGGTFANYDRTGRGSGAAGLDLAGGCRSDGGACRSPARP